MSFKQRQYGDDEITDIKTMISKGLTATQIAAVIESTPEAVRALCSRRDIPMATPSQRACKTDPAQLATARAAHSEWREKQTKRHADLQALCTKQRQWLGKAWRLVLASDGHYYIVPRGVDLPRGASRVSHRRIGGSDISRPAYFEGELAAEYRITPVLPALIHSLSADLAGNNRAAADMLALELAAYDGTYPDTALGVAKALKARHAMERGGWYLYAPTNPERAAVAAIVMRDLLRFANSH
ncbi:MAG: hypothetical protein II007_13590 [Gammaproteobacteria bacterium]|nr:hypothetical protein [Gammaproteobacteria bacterium]